MNIASRTTNRHALLCVATLSLFIGGQQVGALDPLGIGGVLGGVTNTVNDLTSSLNGQGGPMGGSLGVSAGGLGNVLGGVTKPMFGLLGSLTNGLSNHGGNLVGDTLRQATGAINGIASGANAVLGLNGPGGAALAGSLNLGIGGLGGELHPALNKREAMVEGAAAGAAASAAASGHDLAINGAIEAGAHYGAAQGAFGGALGGLDRAPMLAGGAQLVPGFAAGQTAAANYGAFNSAAAAMAGAEASSMAASAASLNAGALANAATGNQLIGRAALAGDAMRNAQAESALAGADMVAHGANNARSASLASNAYRQAKLASARDRVNIAGTIQNSARISDAAIATHDAATRAEDSLLGSELAVDSASTVLDSDGAYIPPVTSSLLRSLPYGRLGVRNIIPKPLTYPSILLPDVWLNGVPVNYINVPLRMLPYTVGSTAATNSLWNSGAALANGQIINGQPFIANNGLLLNGMVVDPALAYLSSGSLGINALSASSIVPILANGQLEAYDEIAAANMLQMHQLNGAGMSATYQGYGRLNPVPMITGSVSDANLQPTTTVGTTYPIGSALVIEPRDSFFQDYVDNASSRQNFDEREQ